MGTILLIVLIILLLGGGGGYYGHRRYGGRGLGGVLGLVLVVILVLWLVGALGHGARVALRRLFAGWARPRLSFFSTSCSGAPSARFVSRARSMDHLAGKAIAPVPERADRTPLAFVVDAFLVRAADDAVDHRDRQGVMGLDELQYLLGDCGVVAHVTLFDLPIAHLLHTGIFGWHDADGDLRGPAG